eukprot:3783253-Amphidinium_carterae.1
MQLSERALPPRKDKTLLCKEAPFNERTSNAKRQIAQERPCVQRTLQRDSEYAQIPCMTQSVSSVDPLE